MQDQVAALEIVSPVGPIPWLFSKDRMKGLKGARMVPGQTEKPKKQKAPARMPPGLFGLSRSKAISSSG
jgi:hypothetical protein